MGSVGRELRVCGVPARIANKPQEFSRGLVDENYSVLMDIRRSNSKKGKNEFNEHLLIYPGKGNSIDLIDARLDSHQAVLRIHEPERSFQVEERTFNRKRRKWESKFTTHHTDDEVHWYLVGMDECHLFIAELPHSAGSVRDARSILRPKKLGKQNTKRQGEWFLIPLDERELLLVYNSVEGSNESDEEITQKKGKGKTRGKTLCTIQRNSKLTGVLPPGRGRPHIAEEVVVVNGNEYARGLVSHPDHKTRYLKDWHRVVRNAEKSMRTVQLKYAQWVD